MNKWEKLLDALAHFRSGLDSLKELYEQEPQVKALLLSRIPLLGVPGSFPTVNHALVDLTKLAMRSREGTDTINKVPRA